MGGRRLFRLAAELGIDLGTSNLLVYRQGHGIVLEEPTVVAVNKQTKKVLAVGFAAREMIGRTPEHIVAIRPLREGVIAEYSYTLRMLEFLVDKLAGRRRWFKPRLMICVPCGATNVERRAVVQAAKEAGAGECFTIEEPVAAAIGAGLPIHEAGGNLVIDIGGGTTDIAVLSLDGVVISESLRIGGAKFDEAIIRHLRNTYNIMVGERTAEEIKVKIGSACKLDQELRLEVRGRDLMGGLPRTIEVTSEEIREALAEPIRAIAEKLCALLESTPPELSSDIIGRGIVITGGGGLLKNLDVHLSAVTDIPVRVADNPMHCVAIGTGRALENHK
jgi:rod shape-determining protein MreB